MSLQPELLPGLNITLVYDALPLDRLDRNRLRAVFNDKQLTVMDIPELAVMFAPTHAVVAQFGDQRVRLTDQRQHAVEQSPLADLATQIAEVIQGSRLMAYGFNYEISLVSDDSQTAAQMLKTRFLPDEEQLALLVGGQIEIVAPRLVFWRSGVRYDLFFDPNPQQLKAHLNVHFAASGLPGVKALKEAMRTEYNLFAGALVGLFSGTRQ